MRTKRSLFMTAVVFASFGATPGRADEPKKPLLFFHAGGVKINLGDAYAETEYGHALGAVHDRMIAGLSKTFDTTVIGHDFRGKPSPADIAYACSQTGAVGAIEAFDSFGAGAGDTFRGAFTLAVLDCNGTEFFSETGASVHGPGKADIADVLLPAMDDAYARLQKDVTDSPKASANYERYGIYMNDEEADSFWLPTVEGKKTVVAECDPLGTAYRAGLRAGDEVRSIDGVPTIGIEVEELNGAMSHALGVGSWTLEIVGKDETARTISFKNETVAWYASHPVVPAR